MLPKKKINSPSRVVASSYDKQFDGPDISQELLEADKITEGTFGVLPVDYLRKLKEGGVDYVPGMDISTQLAARQSGKEQTWRVLKRGGVGILGAAAEPFAFVMDIEHHIKTLQGVEQGYDNTFAAMIRGLEDDVRENNPIYTMKEKPDLMTADWFAANTDQMIRSVGYLLPGSAMFKAGSLMSKLALTKAANVLGKSVAGVAGASEVFGAVSSAIALNYGEHALSAVTHIQAAVPRLTKHYMSEGMDPGQAEEKARQEAYEEAEGIVWGGKVNILWQSMSQLNLFRGIKHSRSAGRINSSAKGVGIKDLASKLAFEMPSEYLEEVTTGYLEKEARFKTDRKLGLRLDDHRATHEKWFEHVQTYEGMTEGLTGAFGAAPMGAITSINQMQQRIDALKNVKIMEASLGADGSKIKDITEDQFFAHAAMSAYKGTYQNFMDMLEGYKNMSPEEAAKLEVEDNYVEIAEQYIKDAKIIEESFNATLDNPLSKSTPGALDVLFNNKINAHRNENNIRHYKVELAKALAEQSELNDDIIANPDEVGLHKLKDLTENVEMYENMLRGFKQNLKEYTEGMQTSPMLVTAEHNERASSIENSIKDVEKALKQVKLYKARSVKEEILSSGLTEAEITAKVTDLKSSNSIDVRVKTLKEALATARQRRKSASELLEKYVKHPALLKAEADKLVADDAAKKKTKAEADSKEKVEDKAGFLKKAVNKGKKAVKAAANVLIPKTEAEIHDKIKSITDVETLDAYKVQLDSDSKITEGVKEALKKKRAKLILQGGQAVDSKGNVTTPTKSAEEEAQILAEAERVAKEKADGKDSEISNTQSETVNKLDAISEIVGEATTVEGTTKSEYPVALPSGEVNATRTSAAINEAHKEDEFTGVGYELNTEWGNIVDKAVEAIINKFKSYDSNSNTKRDMKAAAAKAVEEYVASGKMTTDANITAEAIATIVEGIYALQKANPKAIFKAQVKSFAFTANRKLVAGALDIVMIKEDGRADIIDVKASIHTTKIDKYSKSTSDRSSRKTKHARQQSVYRHYLETHGVKVDNTYILPFFILDNQQYISDVVVESLVTLPHEETTVDKIFNTVASEEVYLSPASRGEVTNETSNSSDMFDINEANSKATPRGAEGVFERADGEDHSKQVSSSQSAGFLSIPLESEVIEIKDGDNYTNKFSTSNSLKEDSKDLHSSRVVQEGDPVVLTLVNSNNEVVTAEELKSMTDAQITKLAVSVTAAVNGVSKKVTALHSVEWVKANNSMSTMDAEVEKAKEIRRHIASLEGKPLTSRVSFKGSGLILQLFEEDSNGRLLIDDGKPIPRNLPVKEALPDWTNIEIGVVVNGEIKVKGATTDKKLFADIRLDDARTVALLPTPNGTYFPTILWVDNITEAQANTIIGAAVAFIVNDTDSFDLIKEKTNIDIGRDGATPALNAFINRYVYASPYSYKYEEEKESSREGQVLVYASDKMGGKLQIVDVDNRTVYTNDANYYFEGEFEVEEGTGTYTGDLKQEHKDNNIKVVRSLVYKSGAEEASRLLQKKLISVDQTRLNLDGEFTDIELDLKGDIVLNDSGSPKTTTYPSYNSYKLNSLSTDINGQNKITHDDGTVEYTYMTQPTILFDFSAIESLEEKEVEGPKGFDPSGMASIEFNEEEQTPKTDQEQYISDMMEKELSEGLIDPLTLPLAMQEDYLQGILPIYANNIINNGLSFKDVSSGVKGMAQKKIAGYKKEGSYKLKAFKTVLDNFDHVKGKISIESLILERLKKLDIIPNAAGYDVATLTEEELSKILAETADFTQDSYGEAFYKVDRKKTVAAEVKFFLASITDTRNKNWADNAMGLRYQEVYDTLRSLLTNVKGGFAEKLAALEEASPSPVYNTVSKNVKNMPLDFQHKFTVAMSGAEIGFVQVLADPTDSAGNKVLNADNYGVISTTMEKWLNYLKTSNLVSDYKGETLIDTRKVLVLRKKYDVIYQKAVHGAKNKDVLSDFRSATFLRGLQSVLNEMGMDVPLKGLHYLATTTSVNRAKYINQGDWASNVNPDGGFMMANIFGAFTRPNDTIDSAMRILTGSLTVADADKAGVEELAEELVRDPNERGLFYINNPIEGEKNEKVVKGLARLTVDYNGVIYGNTLRGLDGKSLYPFQNEFGMQRLLSEYKLTPKEGPNSLQSLLNLSISKGSIWGEKLLNKDEKFVLDIKMFDATKFSKSSQLPKERKNQGEYAQSITSLILFTNKGENAGYFFPLTLSDKDIVPLLKATKWSTLNGDTALSQMVIEDGKIVGIKNTLTEVLANYAMAEYDRIYFHQTEGKQKAIEAKIHRGAYEEGANYFYKYNYLNSYGEGVESLWEADGKTLNLSTPRSEVLEIVKNKVKESAIQEVNEHLETYKDFKITESFLNPLYTRVVKTSLADGKNRSSKDIFAAAIADMALNSMIAFDEQHILFGNDHAHAYKRNAKEDADFHLKATIKVSINNYTKRKSDLLSPSTSPEYSSPTVNIVTVKDSRKIIGGESIERTDGQEMGTILEALEMKNVHGKIPPVIMGKLLKGIKGAIADKNNVDNYYELSDFLTPDEVSKVEERFITDKPVHITNDINVELDSNNKVFRKSSTRWLWPQELRGLELDNLRIAMENLSIGRLGHESSDKTGAINVASIYNEDKKSAAYGELLSREEIERNLTNIDHVEHTEGEVKRTAVRSISRKGLGWQQEKPTNKTKVAQSTQLDVLAFDDLLDVVLQSDKTVGELRTEKEKIVSEFYREGVKSLFGRMGVEVKDGIVTGINVPKVATFLEKSAKDLGWPDKDIAELKTKVVDVVTVGEKVFRSPLMYNNSRKKIEALMLSIIRKDVANIKLPGFGYIQATSTGFRSKGGLTWSEYKEAEGKSKVKEVITFVDPKTNLNYFDETIGLQGPRISEDGKRVLPGQILISPFFKIGGKAIDLTSRNYTRIEGDGKRYLDVTKVPAELLQMIGYRIPGQGRSSVMPLEVVGFLPVTSTATAIIPDEMVAQMGSDFDIDVLYTYRRLYTVGPKGEITKKTDLDPIEKLQSAYFEVMKELIFDPAFVSSTVPLDNTDLRKAANTVDALTGKEHDIKSPIFLRANIQNNISQRTGKMLIAPSSLAGTLYASIQGRGIEVSPDLDGNPIDFTFFEVLNDSKEDGAPKYMQLHANNISRMGFSQAEDNPVKRTSGENNTSVQNAAVDNANNQDLAKAGVNNATVDVALFALGYKNSHGTSISSEQLVYFLRQEAIESYAKHYDYWSSNAEGGYLSFDQVRDKAFNSAMHELETKMLGDVEKRTYSKMDLNDLRKGVDGEFTTFSSTTLKGLFTATKDSIYYEQQVAILAGFRQLQISSDPVKKLQRAIMSPRTKALRSTIFDAESTLEVMEEVFSGELKGLIGVEEALKGTQFETLYDTLTESYKAFGKVMPFDIASHKSILEVYKSEHDGSSPSPAVREHLFNALLEKGYANAFEDTFGENLEDYRNLTLFSMEDSLSAAIQKVQDTPWGRRNLFLQRLIPIIKNDLYTPNTVGYNASKQEDVVDQMHKDLIVLYQSDMEGHRELFEEIVKYAYAVGGNRSAKSFVQFIPPAYLDSIGFYEALRNEERNAKSNYIDAEEVYKEWIQHNPFYATAIAAEDLTVQQFLLDPITEHSTIFNGKNQPYQIVLKPIDKAKHNLEYSNYTTTKDGIERYKNILTIKSGKTIQIFEKVVTPLGILRMEEGVVFRRIPKKGKNTPKYRVSEYSGRSGETVGTVFHENEVPTADFAAEVKPLRITPDVPTKTAPTHTETEEEVYSISDSEGTGRAGVKKLLQDVIDNSAKGDYVMLAEILLGSLDTVGKHIAEIVEGKTIVIDGKTTEVRGAYLRSSKTVLLNDGYLDRPQTFEEVVLHEYLHAYLSSELNDTSSHLYTVIERLRQASLTALDAKKKNTEISSVGDALLDYAFSDVHEFLSHALSNVRVQKFLNTVNIKQTIWSQFKNAIRQFLHKLGKSIGMEIKKDTVLNETIQVVIEAIHIETAESKAALEKKNIEQGVTTLSKQEGIIRADGTFDPKLGLRMHESAANQKVTEGVYTREQVSAALKLSAEIKAKAQDPLASPALIGETDTSAQFINLATERINRLKFKLTSKNLTTVEGQKIRERIATYERQRKTLRDNKNVKQVGAIARSQFKWVRDVLKSGTATNIEFQEALNIVDSYDYDLTSEFLSPSSLNKDNIWNTAVLDLSREASLLKISLLNALREDIFKEIETKLPNLNATRQDLMEIPEEDFLAIKAYTQDLTKFKAPLVKLLNRVLKTSARAAEGKIAKLFKEVDTAFEKIAEHPAFVADPSLFFQKDKEGNSVGYFIHRYSNAWRVDRNKIFTTFYKAMEKIDKTSAASTLAKTMQAKRRKVLQAKLAESLNNIEVAIDVRYWRDDANNEQSTFLNPNFENREAYIKYLDDELGVNVRKELVGAALEKFEQYQLEKGANIAILMADDYASLEEREDRIRAWTNANSPIVSLNARYGKQVNTGRQVGHKRLITAPRSTHKRTGKKLDYYDSAFNTVKNDAALLEFYTYYTETMKTLMKALPDNVVENLPENFWPAATRSTVEKLQQDGMFNTYKIFSKEGIWSWFTSEGKAKLDPTVTVGASRSVDTGEVIKTVPIRMIRGVDADQKSYDIPRVMKMFTAMAKNFEFKAQVEDRVLLLQRALREARELQLDINGNPVKLSRGGKSLSTRNGLKITQEATQYAVNSLLYGTSTDTQEGKLVSKRAADIKNNLKELEEAYATDNITRSKYLEGKKALEDEFDKLDPEKYSLEIALDSVISYTQLKGMGLNITSGINNLSFGTVANYIHAAGAEDFTTSQLDVAYAKTLSSSFTKSKTKVTNIAESYNILFDQLDSQYGEDKKSKGITSTSNLYIFQTRTEFVNQVAPLIAKMLNTIIDDKGTTLFEAYDDNGKIKEEFSEIAEEWSTEVDAVTENKYTKFRDHIIELNKINHGNYDPNSPILLKKSAIGRAAVMFRTWALEGFNTRYAAEDYNDQLDRVTKGRYLSFQSIGLEKSIQFLIKGLLNSTPLKVYSDESMRGDITPLDVANMNKNLSELKTFLILYATTFALKALAAKKDDDEFNYWQVILNTIHRLIADIFFYLHYNTLFDVLKSPSAVIKTLGDVSKAVGSSYDYVTQDDYRGDPLTKKWAKTVPLGSAYHSLQYLEEEDLNNR